MGIQFHWNHTKCSRSSSPPLSSPQLSLLDLPPMEPPLLMLPRSSPPSLMLTSTELLMTTARPTSRRQKLKMPTDSSLMSPTRAPPSPPQSPRRDTAMPPPPTSLLPLTTLKLQRRLNLSRNQ